MPEIRLLDGKKISFNKSINGFDLVKKISKSLEKTALIMEVNGELKDLSFEIKNELRVRTFLYFVHQMKCLIDQNDH